MPRILIASVGGSCEPVINAYREFSPDYIYFFCSSGPKGSSVTVDGPGAPCRDPRQVTCPNCAAPVPLGIGPGESICRRLGLTAERYEKVEVADPDDLSLCYQALVNLEAGIRERFGSDAEVVANYTGGTKTMSLALGLFAVLRERWDLSINRGPRVDLVKVRGGDIPVLADKQSVVTEIHISQARGFLKRFAYDAADDVLAQITTRHRLAPDIREKLMYARWLCQAFHAWDLFDHLRALELLRAAGGAPVGPYAAMLGELVGERNPASGYQRVADLMLNAARRVAQGRYDDAVARLYRAVEMVAQTRLRERRRIETGAVDVEKLPAELRPKYAAFRDGKRGIRLALRNAYQLLVDLNDEVGRLWQEQESRLLGVLETRNKTILAHGDEPLSKDDYEQTARVMEGFIKNVFAALKMPVRVRQLPAEDLLDMTGFSGQR